MALKDGGARPYQSDDHVRNWIECIKSRKVCIADVEIGHRSATVCHLGNIAVYLGRKLQWDPRGEQFISDDEANKWLLKEYREPWEISKI